MRYIVTLSRIIVGLLFIISGLIKLNDPLGFSFKLEEYFSEPVLDMPFFEPYALAIAIIVVIVEVVLGVMLLLGFWPKLTVWSLMGMILFFTFLTWYSAYYNKVTDCGCFGDAIKLTPWQSFGKDVLLLVLIVPLVLWHSYVRPLFANRKITAGLAGVTVLGCILFCIHVLNHLPVKDFRPYKIGANIKEGMEIPENAPRASYEYAWKFKVNGNEQIVVTPGDYPSVDGEFIGVETTEISPGYEPPIHDFTIEKGDADFTEQMLAAPKLVMVIAYDISKSDLEAFRQVKQVTDKAIKKGYNVIGMSASGGAQTTAVKKEYGLDFDFYFTDATTLKTIVRANPGVLVLEKGTIVAKAHHNDIDQLTF